VSPTVLIVNTPDTRVEVYYRCGFANMYMLFVIICFNYADILKIVRQLSSHMHWNAIAVL
jgi:hypothetical protein